MISALFVDLQSGDYHSGDSRFSRRIDVCKDTISLIGNNVDDVRLLDELFGKSIQIFFFAPWLLDLFRDFVD